MQMNQLAQKPASNETTPQRVALNDDTLKSIRILSAGGLTSQKIAEVLDLSPFTVNGVLHPTVEPEPEPEPIDPEPVYPYQVKVYHFGIGDFLVGQLLTEASPPTEIKKVITNAYQPLPERPRSYANSQRGGYRDIHSLSDNEVMEIHSLYHDVGRKMKVVRIADKLNISSSNVYRILSGDLFRHIFVALK